MNDWDELRIRIEQSREIWDLFEDRPTPWRDAFDWPLVVAYAALVSLGLSLAIFGLARTQPSAIDDPIISSETLIYDGLRWRRASDYIIDIAPVWDPPAFDVIRECLNDERLEPGEE